MKLIKLGVAALLLVTVAAVAALVSGPSSGQAADHVDAPGLTPPGGNFQLDITDIYAWRGKSGRTVLALNVNGLAKPGAKPVFASGVPSVKKTKGHGLLFRHPTSHGCCHVRSTEVDPNYWNG
jgi:hypothetical protein